METRRLLIRLIVFGIFFGSIICLYGITFSSGCDSTNQDEKVTKPVQSPVKNQIITKPYISKEKAIKITLKQLDLVRHLDWVICKVLGIIKINGRKAWEIKCKITDSTDEYVIYVDTKTGESKKNKKNAQ